VGYVTLHVGLGTFRPVKAEHIERHEMHAEHYHVPEAAAALVNQTKAQGGRVICVGTTACRTLEAVAQAHGAVVPCEGWTDIFIYPGYEFRCADALLTNFHLPGSTLIMLVSAFYGREKTLAAYETAVREGYRFYSFGDCMVIL
jgi:S-adenosylmethionine:tRNA ribosyltransferase-isomerase